MKIIKQFESASGDCAGSQPKQANNSPTTIQTIRLDIARAERALVQRKREQNGPCAAQLSDASRL